MEEWKSPIPKHVHFIWIGNQDIPDYFMKYFKRSFEENMYPFKFTLWRNKDLTSTNFPKTYSYIQKIKKIHGKPMIGKDEDGEDIIFIDSFGRQAYHNKWAQITDLMRLEIIYNHGGYYFDINFEILPSKGNHTIYNLLNSTKKRFVGCNEISVEFEEWPYLSNSFFGATKHNPIMKRLLSKEYLQTIDIQSGEIANETGPAYLRLGIYSNDSYHIFPYTYFYPFYEDPKFSNTNEKGRVIKPNKCHKGKTKNKSYHKLKNKKGYILFPCHNYPKSYALKHWELGKSWLT